MLKVYQKRFDGSPGYTLLAFHAVDLCDDFGCLYFAIYNYLEKIVILI